VYGQQRGLSREGNGNRILYALVSLALGRDGKYPVLDIVFQYGGDAQPQRLVVLQDWRAGDARYLMAAG